MPNRRGNERDRRSERVTPGRTDRENAHAVGWTALVQMSTGASHSRDHSVGDGEASAPLEATSARVS